MTASDQSDNTANQPLITFTDAAQARVLDVMKSKGLENHTLRVGIQGRGPDGFQFGMSFEGPSETTSEDSVVDVGAFKVVMDSNTVRHAHGAKVDFDAEAGGGFQIENPNPMWDDPKAQMVQELIDTQINPAVARHGGVVQLIDVKDNIVYVQLGGGCQGCGMVDVTLRQGIEVLIKEALPEIEQVVDTTNHAGGANPYYQPSKK